MNWRLRQYNVRKSSLEVPLVYEIHLEITLSIFERFTLIAYHLSNIASEMPLRSYSWTKTGQI